MPLIPYSGKVVPAPQAPAVKPYDGEVLTNAPDPAQAGNIGVLGTLTGGAKTAARSIGATISGLQGDKAAIEAAAEESKADKKDTRLEQFNADVQQRFEASGKDAGVLSAAGDIAGAALDNPVGAGLSLIEQFPNSVPTMVGGYAGMKAGGAAGAALGSVVPGVGTAVGGTVGALVGGAAGMWAGNAGIESGYKLMEKADGGLTDEELNAGLTEGGTKGAVITGVDLITLGLGGKLAGAVARASERAGVKVLADAGVDVADAAAVAAARQANPILDAAVKAAETTRTQKAATAAALIGMETVGEGTGEYLGELAATGEASVQDAVLESVMSLGQSGVETAWNIARAGAKKATADKLVQPTPTAENPAPAPVDRPDPNNGVLSRATNLLPAPAATPGLPFDGPNAGPTQPFGGPGLEQQVGGNVDPLTGDYIPAFNSPFATAPGSGVTGGDVFEHGREQPNWNYGEDEAGNPLRAALPSPQALLEDQRADTGILNVDAQGNAIQGKASTNTKSYVPQGGTGMDQPTYNGMPAAKKALRETGNPDAYEVVKVGKQSFAVQAKADMPSNQIAGEEIGDGWMKFGDETGGLKVPRAEMPQIKAEHRGAMVNFLNARGIAHEEQTVPAGELKPTQTEFSTEKVAKAKAYEGGDRSILISSDGHVLDGHHQWLAKLDKGEDVKAIRLSAPMTELLPVVGEFPSSTLNKESEGAVQSTPAKAESNGGLSVRFGGQTFPVESIEDAQAKWRAFRDETNAGVSSIGNGIEVLGADGKQVARISYNGRAWGGNEKEIQPAITADQAAVSPETVTAPSSGAASTQPKVAVDHVAKLKEAARRIAAPSKELKAEAESLGIENVDWYRNTESLEFAIETAKEGAKPDQLNTSSVTQAPITAKPAKRKGARKTVDRDKDTVVEAVIRLGGLTNTWKQDTTGDTKGNKGIPGVGYLWSDKNGTGIDDMARHLDDEGYVPHGEMAKDGGVSWLQSVIKDELGGIKKHYAPGSAKFESEMLQREADHHAAQAEQLNEQLAAAEEDDGWDSMEVVKSDLLDEHDLADIRRAEAQRFADELDAIFEGRTNEENANTPEANQPAAQKPGTEEGGNEQAGSGEQAPTSTAYAGRAGEPEAFSLTTQSEDEIAEKESREQAALDKAAEDKRIADAARDNFGLSQGAAVVSASNTPTAPKQQAGDLLSDRPMTRGEKKAADEAKAKAANKPRTAEDLTDAEYKEISDEARYLKDVAYSVGNLTDDKNALVALSTDLAKSGRDTLLMEAFNIDRNLAHTINNNLDDKKPRNMRPEDMEEAFKTFTGLRGIIDAAIAESERRAAAFVSAISVDSGETKAAPAVNAEKGSPSDKSKRDAEADAGRKAIAAMLDRRFAEMSPETEPFTSDEGVEYVKKSWTITGNLYGSELQALRDVIGNGNSLTLDSAELLNTGLKLTGKYVGTAKEYRAWKTVYEPVDTGNRMVDRWVSLAADSIEKLRASDVGRVLEQAQSPDSLNAAAQYLKSKRPDLSGTIGRDAEAIAEENGWGAKEPAAKPDALTQTFTEWLDASWANNRYRETYIEDYNDEATAKYASVSTGGTTEAQARQKYEKELLDQPRDSALDLKVYDQFSEQPAVQRSLERHFFGVEDQLKARASSDLNSKVDSPQEKAKQARITEIDAEIAELSATINRTESGTQADAARQKKIVRLEAERDKLRKLSVGEYPQYKSDDSQQDAKPQEKIEDFGERLLGARKFATYSEKLKQAEELDVSAVPLSKSWPAPDYQDLIDGGADAWGVAFMRAARDEIPNKPTKGYKLTRWVAQVEQLREFAQQVATDPEFAKSVQALVSTKYASLKGWIGRADLYAQFGHEVSLKGLTFQDHYYQFYKGQNNVSKWVVSGAPAKSGMSNWPREVAAGDTREEAITAFGKVHAKMIAAPETADTGPTIRFDIFTNRTTGEVFIAKKNGKRYAKLKTLSNIHEARDYLKTHQKDLEAQYEQMKVQPETRGSENAPRVGADYRNGQDVTPELFGETFGFRGVQFGNWVEDKRRQKDLNDAYDGLMDLAGILNIPARSLSLNGKLGLAFGARGKGGKDAGAAHYEPDQTVINLTKAFGAGSLAHEWWHALDNYFSKAQGQLGYLTEDGGARGNGVRPEMVAAFKELMKAVNLTGIKERSGKRDETRSKDYWSTGREMTARSFESYVIAKLADNGISSDYLANVVRGEAVERDELYPYPTAGEMPKIRAAYDHIFDVIEASPPDESGNIALFSLGASGASADGKFLDRGAVNKLAVQAVGEDATTARFVFTSYASLPVEIREEAASQGVKPGEVKAVHWNGKTYMVDGRFTSAKEAKQAIFHEHYVHFGLRAKYGTELAPKLRSLLDGVGGLDGVRELARAQGIDLSKYEKGTLGNKNIPESSQPLIIMEELMAHMGHATGTLKRVIQEAVGAIRAWLRKNGYFDLATLGITDLANELKMARKAAQEADHVDADGDVRFMFVGKKAATADTFRLSDAQAMLAKGIRAEAVRRDTGWFVGVDGEWRFEIADNEARLIDPPIADSWEAFFGKMERLQFGKNVSPSTMKAAEFNRYKQYRMDREADYNRRNGRRELQSLLSHPKLFAAYPDLAGIEVSFVDPASTTYRGMYYSGRDEITLSNTGNLEELRSVLLHEIQHAIQYREGFASGGNTGANFVDAVKKALKDGTASYNYFLNSWKFRNNDKITAAEKAADAARFGLMYESATRLVNYAHSDSPSGQFRLIRNEMQWIYAEQFRGNEQARDLRYAFYDIPKRHKMRERNAKIAQMALDASQFLMKEIPAELREQFKNDPRTMKGMLNALERESSKAKKQLAPMHKLEQKERALGRVKDKAQYAGAYEIYRALAGEVEARNTQKRLDMDDDQRKAASIQSTADVNAEDVIVMFGGMDVRAPVSMANMAQSPAQLGLQVEDTPLGKMYTDGGSRIAVMEDAKYAPRKHSITDFVVGESERGKGAGGALLDKALKLYNKNDISAAASSAASVAAFYRRGFRPISEPAASLDRSKELMRELSSVTMVVPIKTDSAAFEEWFGDSKVVDADGKPMVVYHGTTADFTAFDRNETRTGVLGEGFYFSPEPERTRSYAGGSRFGGQGYAEGGNVMPVYVSLQNPLVLRAGQRADLSAESKGHDGVIQLDAGGGIETVVAFSPEQIKSAIGNNGNYSKTDPRINYRLNDNPSKGIPLFSAQAIAKKLNAKLGLKVQAVANEAGLPDAVQAQIKRDKATGKVAGVYHEGVSYVIASNLYDTKHAIETVLHEAIGHGGVKAVLGEKLGKVMQGIYRDMPSAMRRELHNRYADKVAGLSKEEAEIEIAEEYVAHLAEHDPRNSVIGRLVALIRQFLRDTFGERAALKWTRNDIVQLLAEARVAARSPDNNGGGSRYRQVAEQHEAPELAEVGEADEAEFVASLKGPALKSVAASLYKAQGTGSPFFRKWFGKSRMVKDGQPIAFYHRSFEDKQTFDDARLGGNTGTPTAALGHYLSIKDENNVERYGPVSDRFYIRMENPKVIGQASFESMGDWDVEEVKAYRAKLMKDGYDGIYIKGLGWPVVFEGKNIKGVRNQGTFDDSNQVRYSVNTTAAERETMRKLGMLPEEADSLLQQIRDAGMAGFKRKMAEWGQRAKEGLFDGLEGIKQAETELGITDPDRMGYVSARLATGIADVMHGTMHYAAPEWRDGIIQARANTKGVLEVLGSLGGDLTPWLVWVGSKRAEILKQQGRENNMSDADIATGLAMGAGKEALFEQVYQDYAKINEAVLDLAQGAGLIDPAARAAWLTDYYVPFYRETEDSIFSGPRTSKGLSHQSAAIKALKGGDMPTKDLLENMLQGWTKRIDAAMKNKALMETVDNLKGSRFMTQEDLKWQRMVVPRAEVVKKIKGDRVALEFWAEQLGLDDTATHLEVAHELNKLDTSGYEELWGRVAPTDPDVIRVQRNGKNEYYRVHDEALLRSVKHMEGSMFNDPVTKLGRSFKRMLTTGVTASPDFIMRNFIRDAVHAWAINPDGFKFGLDSFKGLHAAFKEDSDYRDLMFAGASFQGGYVHATDPEASAQIIRRALAKKGMNRQQQAAYLGSLVTSPAQVADMVQTAWQKYRELGDVVENANRLSTYKAAIKSGKSMRQAAFESKDLMDYSMRGNFAAAIWLTDMVPFLNARLQGLYKLGRATKDERGQWAKEFAKNAGYIALFSLLLAGANDDDDRYKSLPDWDKDMNWHFWFSADQEQPFRIPKPFEIGLIFGTMPERMLHAATGTQDSSDLFRSVVHGIFDTLSFNPVPQMVHPIREVQANRDLFRNSPIEDMSDEGKLPEARYDERTSAIGYSLGQVTGRLAGVSPKQVDHLIKGYTGTLGAYVLSMSNVIAEQFSDAERPAYTAADIPVVKTMFQGDTVRSTRYQTEFYDALTEAEQIYRTVKAYREDGQTEKASELQADNAGKLRHRQALGFARRQLGIVRQRMDAVYRDTSMGSEQKRTEIDRLQRNANQIAERIAKQVKGDF